MSHFHTVFHKPTSAFTHQPHLDPVYGSQLIEESQIEDLLSSSEDLATLGMELPTPLTRWELESRYKQSGDHRELFEKDRDKIASSTFLKRLQHVSQVELFATTNRSREHETQHKHSRLTHTYEVARIASRVARNVCQQQPDLARYYSGVDLFVVEACALAHDMGHPPFGHVCEQVLATLMKDHGGFEGNAQTLRILAALDARNGSNFLHLTRRTWASCMKYPWTHSEAAAFGTRKYSVYDLETPGVEAPYLSADHEIFRWTFGDHWTSSHQSMPDSKGAPRDRIRTPESEIMDFADDIAYSTSDFCEAIQYNKELEMVLKWDGFVSFISTNRTAFDSTIKAALGDAVKIRLDDKTQLRNCIDLDKRASVAKPIRVDKLHDENIVDWDILYFFHRHFRLSDRGPQEESSASTDFRRLETRAYLENAFKDVLLNPQISYARVFDGNYVPLTSSMQRSPTLTSSPSHITEFTFCLIPPEPWKVSETLVIHTVTRKSRFIALYISLLKLFVTMFVHREGPQREVQVVGAVRCALLVHCLADHLYTNSDQRKAIVKTAKHHLLDEYVEDVARCVKARSVGTPPANHAAYPYVLRFCCDLVASLMKSTVEKYFQHYCLTPSQNLTEASEACLEKLISDEEFRKEHLGSAESSNVLREELRSYVLSGKKRTAPI